MGPQLAVSAKIGWSLSANLYDPVISVSKFVYIGKELCILVRAVILFLAFIYGHDVGMITYFLCYKNTSYEGVFCKNNLCF